jgi:hypothetical protein
MTISLLFICILSSIVLGYLLNPFLGEMKEKLLSKVSSELEEYQNIPKIFKNENKNILKLNFKYIKNQEVMDDTFINYDMINKCKTNNKCETHILNNVNYE